MNVQINKDDNPVCEVTGCLEEADCYNEDNKMYLCDFHLDVYINQFNSLKES